MSAVVSCGLSKERTRVRANRRDRSTLEVDKGLRAVYFWRTVCMVHIGCAKLGLHTFPAELPWSSHRFYIRRRFRKSTIKASTIYEYWRVHLVLLSCIAITCSS